MSHEKTMRAPPPLNRGTEQEFTLRLKALSGWGWQTPPWMRLRAALKRLLRDYGLRCVECAPHQPVKPQSSNEAKAP
jgi:hypothetical protein